MTNCPNCSAKLYWFKKGINGWTCDECLSKVNYKGGLIESHEKHITGKCPHCGSKHFQPVSIGETKGFSTGTGCCGAILFGPFGWLCGLSGMGKGKTVAKRMCMKCGKTF